MKKMTFLVCLVSALLFGQTAQAGTALIHPITDDKIGTTTVTIKFVNVRAAKKFKFELYDRRAGRTQYRKVFGFFQARKSKKSKNLTIHLSGLKPDRDYRIRYRAVFLGDRTGIWSDYATFRTKNKAIYFYLDTEDSLLADDVPYLELDDTSTTEATTTAYAMAEQSDGRWFVEIEGIAKDDVLQYRFSRNNLGPRSYEQFEPDDVDHLRSLTISEVPETKELTVTDWRLLPPTTDTDTVSSEAWPVTARDPFVLGTALTTNYPDDFMDYSAATFESIAALGLTYVAIPYANRVIINGDPVETNHSVDGYPTETQIATMLTELQAAGLTPILMIDLPINAEQADTITEAMTDTHGNSYFSTYLTRWREAMNDGLDFAVANNIDIVVLATPFDDFNFQNNTQQQYFSYILENDILPNVGSDYSGILTTKELSTDSDFTWYQSNKIDWLGDSWYPTIADTDTPTITDMYTEALDQLAATYQPLADQYNKPVFFANLGVFSIDGAASLGETIAPTANALNPDRSSDTYSVDTQEQADAYEALFRAIAETEDVIGAVAPDYSFMTQYDKLSNIRDKTASLVWQRWYSLFFP
ncbi:MAG: hypothetical protein HY565_01435 [Candidatus Kerfeldbacteria bacterium]|nr:hypothetical protein [Candidatus Kerfeldbacteria bacterium]